MFKRKLVEVRDNRFLTMLEDSMPSSPSFLTPKELYALRYHFGTSKVNIHNPYLIKEVKMNDIRHYEDFYIITSKDGYYTYCSKLSDVKDLLSILNQRIMLISEDEEKEITSIKIYSPSTDDTMLYVDNDLLSEPLYANVLKNDNIDFFVIDSEKVESPKDLSKEIFAFTKQNVLHSSIVIHYVP